MKSSRFGITLAAVFLFVFGAFWLWQTPGLLRRPLRGEEIEALLAAMERNAIAPPELEERVIAEVRAWAERDDGKPVFMLNLMRYYPELRPIPGMSAFHGSPADSNAYYEAHVMPIALADGDSPIFSGTPQGGNLIGHDPAADDWSRILVMRYPSRAHFLPCWPIPPTGRCSPTSSPRSRSRSCRRRRSSSCPICGSRSAASCS